MNPQARPTGTPLTLMGAQASSCGPSANWYNFNSCQGVDMNAFMTGLWNHEGLGSNGRNGHEGAARVAAAELANDPYAGAEPFVIGPVESVQDFQGRIRSEIVLRAGRINAYAKDGSPNVTGNWSGIVYVWDHSANKFAGGSISF